jgi:hypothetical protein
MNRTGLLISNDQCQCGIERVSWHERMPNLIDYDFVILDKASLNEFLLSGAKGSKHNLFIQNPANELTNLRKNLELVKTKVLEMLPLEDRKIFVLYAPSRAVQRKTKKMGLYDLVDTYEDFVNSDDWCPLQILVHEESGKHIRIINDSYTDYLRVLDGWGYYFLTDKLRIHGLSEHYSGLGQDVSLTLSPIAASKAGQTLAMSMRFNFAPASKGMSPKASQMPKAGAEILLLPPSDDIAASVEGIMRIAEPQLETVEPVWISKIKVPEEDQLLVEVSRLRQEAQEVEDSLSERKKYRDYSMKMASLYRTSAGRHLSF